MSKTKTKTQAAQSEPRNLPLFYKEPVVLRFDVHGKKAVKPFSGYGFSADTLAVPLMQGEFAYAGRHYPIVFTQGDNPTPLALLGLKERQNLFLQTDGSWRAGAYVPGYLRRYPYIFTQIPESGEMVLAIDSASQRFTDVDAGDVTAEALFDDAGGATPAAQQALQFCHAYHADHLRSAALGKALKEQGLLVERQASLQFPDNSSYKLDGFCVVDAEKFQAITDAQLLADWHGNGWLAAINIHLASLLNWETLMAINAEQTKPAIDAAA